MREVDARGHGEAGDDWTREIAALARGRPGLAAAMARFAADWRRAHGYWPMPPFVLAVVREETVVRALQAAAPPSRRGRKT